MTAKLLLPAGSDRDNRDLWIAARRSGIGASDVSAILGLSNYKSARDVYYDKIEGEQVEQTEQMLWGQLLEPVVRDQFTVRSGVNVTAPIGLHGSTEYPIMLCTPDGLCSDGGLYEGKAARRSEDWINEQVPDHAELQVQHGMAVMGLGHAWVCGLLYGAKMVYRRVDRDEKLIDMIVKAENTFWYDHVLRRIPPPLDGSEASEKTIKGRYPTAVEKSIELDPREADKVVAEYRAAKASQDKDDYAYRLAQNRMREMLGLATDGTVNGEVIFSWRQNGSKFDEEAFTADHPDLARRYTKSITIDVLDKKALATDHPEKYARYRNRVLRVAPPKKT